MACLSAGSPGRTRPPQRAASRAVLPLGRLRILSARPCRWRFATNSPSRETGTVNADAGRSFTAANPRALARYHPLAPGDLRAPSQRCQCRFPFTLTSPLRKWRRPCRTKPDRRTSWSSDKVGPDVQGSGLTACVYDGFGESEPSPSSMRWADRRVAPGECGRFGPDHFLPVGNNPVELTE